MASWQFPFRSTTGSVPTRTTAIKAFREMLIIVRCLQLRAGSARVAGQSTGGGLATFSRALVQPALWKADRERSTKFRAAVSPPIQECS